MTQAETTAIRHSIKLTDTHKKGESYEKMNMKTMIILGYVFGLFGVIIEGIIPEVPDRITVGLIVVGLTTANWLQWKEHNRSRDNHRQDLKDLIQKNTEIMQELKDLIKQLK